MPKAPKEKKFECKHDYGGTRGVCTHVSRMHSGEKPFVCDHIINKITGEKCGKSFGLKCNMTKHIDAIHLKKKDHVCDHIIDEIGTKCGQAFGEKSSMKRHINVVHKGIRKHVCDHIIDQTTRVKCGQAFGQKSHMNEHIDVVHLGIRNHVCDHIIDGTTTGRCGGCFGCKSDLNDHIMTTHTDKNSPAYLAFREKNNIWYRERYANNVKFKASARIRASFAHFKKTKGGKGTKTLHTEVIVGCTWDQLVVHLHENPHGYTIDMDHIDIDHIRPVCSFTSVDDPIEQHRCMNFNNLQLLPAAENRGVKRDFYDAVAYAQTEASKAIEKLVPGWVAKYRG
jgi:hypothetical protein